MIALEDGERCWLVETMDHESVWFEWVVERKTMFRSSNETYASRHEAEAEASAALVRLRRVVE